uniref:Uncharacterized protein n=1 Tax=Trypanosoma vivax (strain Y486) TaxID=1055687 RepID=G0U0I6_TRYVY|nr:conserved hypothetical protein [Trypanosoma vivax Y486]
MPMSEPFFTTNPQRIARLQENYDAGVEREKIPPEVRERLDLECVRATRQHIAELNKKIEMDKKKKKKTEKNTQ